MTVGQECFQVERISHAKVLSEMIVQMLEVAKQYYHHSNALANVTSYLIGHQKFVTVYSAINHQKPDILSNIGCDWSTQLSCATNKAYILYKKTVQNVLKLKSTLQFG